MEWYEKEAKGKIKIKESLGKIKWLNCWRDDIIKRPVEVSVGGCGSNVFHFTIKFCL